MRVLVYSTRPYDRQYLTAANRHGEHELHFTEARLNAQTATLADGYSTVCCFVDDELDREVLQQLAKGGTRLVALRSTGFNTVDLQAADTVELTVMRVARYSPYAVAEFAVGLMLALNRKIHRAYNRVREGNFLLDGLMGFDMHDKAVGIVGTGKIGTVLARIMSGFGCRVLGYDVRRNPECERVGMQYYKLADLLSQSDIVSLHLPLTPQTHHLIDAQALRQIKTGAMLINTSRGKLIDTEALIESLKSGQLAAVGLDVYEEEENLYFRDLSDEVIPDDVFARLLTFPNVLVTGHQAFFTREAVVSIAETTMQNISDFAAGKCNANTLQCKDVIADDNQGNERS